MLRTTPTIEECYRRYDAQDKGYLTKSELKWAVTALLGSAPSRLVLLSLFEIAPASYEIMQVEKDTFVRVMTRRVANIDVTEGIRRWFKAFDLDSSGFISLANFKQVCQAIAPHMTPSVVHQLFREADTNHDDKVSYGEFERLMLLSLQLQTLAPHP
ncbi:hypothetical protein, variant 5 [Aphanomyces astaci]|uniref:EF-hand domain-containing protein n=1 Tax=Aphanomyces astaci TaxID=112090 RepID=W4GCF6_APHAT|nr:hypothetical protein, variant 2 [Aphanomyces astaci]XP_009833158.1 hypothetical protein, variant 3 [Aphanomyces astaci]XP_009833159.1 hypothetical protein, variant 4 [Aphanomyces astaci]XP_009833160.1 hypothetical protein, variant 5 [Aphanomyces astaci]ETV77370.1 hypothetical protein, variant 2 [Aphanomyces astaci]ETV77371.1 hypothetical protein, variant 3 [Aphanomyces astaci]ETV77372.1 hypothetical protein, variant 4 [Aphanomyces astaci]ETV77373.1 hypothetical protein, variant 5 [Aphanom|eukprot:XP_009833157.1 hypothetical protein, variant 2 [Aphanomyces astaci]